MNDKTNCKTEHQPCGNCNRDQHRRGPSSFHMQDPKLVFDALNLKKGNTFLDIGCGIGDYSLEASTYLGKTGTIYAMDLNPNSIAVLKDEIETRLILNIKTLVVDAAEPIPLENNSIDICFIATALHAMDLSGIGKSLFTEIKRVLADKGKLFIIECHKTRSSFGPPEMYRISPEELGVLATPFGFREKRVIDLGHNYLIQFDLEN